MEEFSYTLTGNLIFPFDFSQNQFSKLCESNPYQVRTRITNTPWFQQYHYALHSRADFHDETARKRVNDRSDAITITTEVFPFLSHFMREASRLANAHRDDNDDGVRLKEDFFLSLDHHLQEAGEKEAYCARILYQDPDFSRVVMSNLWKRELDKRFQLLCSLAEQASSSMQAQYLVECSARLDEVITDLEEALQTDPHTPEQPSSLNDKFADILLSLNQHRKPMSSDKETPLLIKSYCVPNLSIFEQGESYSFFDLFPYLATHNSDPALHQRCRERYLQYLIDQTDASEFELLYKDYLDYAKAIVRDLPGDTLQALIEKRCKQYYRALIEHINYSDFQMPETPDSEFTQYKALTNLIERMIQRHFLSIETFLRPVTDEIQYYNALYDMISREWERIGDSFSGSPSLYSDAFKYSHKETGTAERAEYLHSLLRSLWEASPVKGTQTASFPDKLNSTDEDVASWAESLYPEYATALRWFDLKESPVAIQTVTAFCLNFRLVFQIIRDQEHTYSFPYLVRHAPTPLKILCVVFLYRSCVIACTHIQERISALQQLYLDREPSFDALADKAERDS